MSCWDTLNRKNQIRTNNRLDLKKLIEINSLILEILRCVCTVHYIKRPLCPLQFSKISNLICSSAFRQLNSRLFE